MSRGAWVRALLASLLLGVAGASGAVPASAHSQLVSSTPEDGAVLSAPPTEVAFTFDEDLLAGVDVIAITDADGNVVTSTPVEPQGPTVRMPWPAGLPAGMYQVSYRVVSGDGHPVTGAITITVEAAPSAPPVATPVASPSNAISSPMPAPVQSPPTQTDDGGSTAPVIGIVIGVAVVAAVIALLIGWRRRSR